MRDRAREIRYSFCREAFDLEMKQDFFRRQQEEGKTERKKERRLNCKAEDGKLDDYVRGVWEKRGRSLVLLYIRSGEALFSM